jgi:hypothetical protein
MEAEVLDVRPITIGFDLRLQRIKIEVPEDVEYCIFDQDGDSIAVTGTREEIVEALTSAGYEVVN